MSVGGDGSLFAVFCGSGFGGGALDNCVSVPPSLPFPAALKALTAAAAATVPHWGEQSWVTRNYRGGGFLICHVICVHDLSSSSREAFF